VQVELEQLLILQDRAQKIRQVEAELRSLPLERKSLDSQVAAASANLEATKDRARHVEVEKKKLELDVGTRNDSITRLKDAAVRDAQKRRVLRDRSRDRALSE
jgi:chromosome segregation ATPase